MQKTTHLPSSLVNHFLLHTLGLSLLLLLTVSTFFAQETLAGELTSADRLSALYSSQLVFDEEGVPLVRVGIADGLSSVSFVPSTPLRVLPNGPDGPELLLPPKHRYTLEISKGSPGSYLHHVVLERFDPDQISQRSAAIALWKSRGIKIELLELGSLFAISGRIFDTRETLIVTPSSDTKKKAQDRLKKLEKAHNLSLKLYSELSTPPSAQLKLTSEELPLAMINQHMLWIDLGKGEVTLSLGRRPGSKDRTYQGHLIFTPDRNGKLAVTNAAPVEEILRGVVPAEIFPTAPIESLKVQAIAARGTMISQVGARHLADPYHLCDEQHCQVFKGSSAATKRTDAAIAATRGQVLFGKGRIAETFYSSNCGGTSERPEDVWGSRPRIYLHAHHDDAKGLELTIPPTDAELKHRLSATPKSWCNTTDFSSGRHFRWEKKFTASEIDGLLKKLKLGRIRDIKVLERGVGGRVVKLRITGSKGDSLIERELPVRRLFGGLKSGLFTLKIDRDTAGKPTQFNFKGAGFGHGVGMCQTGAMGMATAKYSFREILEHYYQGAHLEDLW